MINPCTKEKAALHRYSPSVHNRIFPILSKSIPPVPLTFATRPLNSSVVALPRIFGPTILNTVPTMANQTNLILTHITQQFFYCPGEILCLFSVHSSPSHRSPGGTSAIFTHNPVPPVTAVNVQSADIPRRTAEVLCAFPYRQLYPHPVPESGQHEELC